MFDNPNIFHWNFKNYLIDNQPFLKIFFGIWLIGFGMPGKVGNFGMRNVSNMRTAILTLTMLLSLISCRQTDESFTLQRTRMEENPAGWLALADSAMYDARTTIYGTSTLTGAKDYLLYRLAEYYTDNDRLPPAEELSQCVRTLKDLGSNDVYLQGALFLGRTYMRTGNGEEAVNMANEGLSIAEKLRDNEMLFSYFSFLAEIYLGSWRQEEYLRYISYANDYLSDMPPEEMHLKTKILGAENYISLHEFDKAGALIESAKSSITNSSAFISDYWRVTGELEHAQNKYEASIGPLTQALQTDKGKDHLFCCYFYLSEAYSKIGDSAKAQEYSDSASAHITDYESAYDILHYYRYLSECPWIKQNQTRQDSLSAGTIALYEEVFDRMNDTSIDDAINDYVWKSEDASHLRNIIIFAMLVIALLTGLILLMLRQRHTSRSAAESIMLLSKKNIELEELHRQSDEVISTAKDVIRRELYAASLLSGKESKAKAVEDILTAVPELKKNMILQGQWDAFYQSVDFCFNGFHSKLCKKFPNLKDKEIQLCCMTVAGMEIKEIAEIWDLSVSSVYKIRTAIRKQLEIEAEDNMDKALMDIIGRL